MRHELGKRDAAISIRGVTKSFGDHTVLDDISFDVPRRQISAILGPSGTGKSVLLKNVIGLLQPERGEIWVDDIQIVGLREKDLGRRPGPRLRRRGPDDPEQQAGAPQADELRVELMATLRRIDGAWRVSDLRVLQAPVATVAAGVGAGQAARSQGASSPIFP